MKSFVKKIESYYVKAQSMSYGTFPAIDIFTKAFEDKLDGEFYWNLKSSDAAAAYKLGFAHDERWNDADEFYADLKKMYSKGNETLQDLVSGVMGLMGFEWV